jgi:hypothetical protein
MMKFGNKRRAARALAALRGLPTNGRAAGYYNHSARTDWQECADDGISDLLADMRHLCDALDLNFAELDSRAHRNYVEETFKSVVRAREKGFQ